jgi:hypothetical protein
LLDGAFDGITRWQHDPDDATGCEPSGKVSEVLCRFDAFSGVGLHRIGAAVVHDYLVTTLEQSLHHVAAHAAQPNHPQLHRRVSR